MAMADDWLTVTGAAPVDTLWGGLIDDGVFGGDSDGVTALGTATTLRAATTGAGRWSTAVVTG